MTNKAFTTIEIALVVVIIVGISGLAAVSFSAFGPKKLEAAGRQIISDLYWLREMAVNRRRDYIVRFDSNSYDIYHTSVDPANWIKQENIEVSLISPATPFDVVFYRFNDSPYRLGGTAFCTASVNNQLVIILEEGGRNQLIRLFERTGFARLE